MYYQIASALIDDILSGKLKPGDQLPPQRDLSVALGVTVGTVSRAFGEVIRADLIEAGSRRGTRVKDRAIARGAAGSGGVHHNPIPVADLRGHQAACSNWGAEISSLMAERGARGDIDDVLRYDDFAGRLQHREAGAMWLSRAGNQDIDPARVIVTNGAQHALLCALMSLAKRGDKIATERLTYSGLKAVAPLLGLTLIPVDIDEHGIVPASFAKVCAAHEIAGLVCVPNIHNPTTAVLPLERREQLVQIAKEHELIIIEDDVYSGLVEPALPSLASLAPDRVIRLTSFSKTLAPGLRIGYIEAPRRFFGVIADAVRGTTWMASPIAAELATELIISGQAEKILGENRKELALRNAALQKQLAQFDLKSKSYAPHAWLELPTPWTVKQFATWSEAAGFKVASAEGFSVSRDDVTHAVRLSVSAVSPDELTRIGKLISEALAAGPQGNDMDAYP